jgi:hypothetical protein
VGERAGQRPQVVVEHGPVDVVDGVTSLVVAAVIDLAGLPAPGSCLPACLLVRVAVLGAADRDACLDVELAVEGVRRDDGPGCSGLL